MLTINRFVLGPFETNCYVVQPGEQTTSASRSISTDRCWVIDVGYEPDELIAFLQTNQLSPEAIVLTHAHADHIAGIRSLLDVYPGTPIVMHEAEKDWLADPVKNLSAAIDICVTAPPAARLLKGGEILTLGRVLEAQGVAAPAIKTAAAESETAIDPLAFHVLHTPGHSPGSVSFYSPAMDLVFAGDTLFAGSIGRTDFPGSDFDTLARSIYDKLYILPDATRVLPGHGAETTIGHERVSNPFVRG